MRGSKSATLASLRAVYSAVENGSLHMQTQVRYLFPEFCLSLNEEIKYWVTSTNFIGQGSKSTIAGELKQLPQVLAELSQQLQLFYTVWKGSKNQKMMLCLFLRST